MLKLRPRRLRLNENLRSMVRETNLSVKDLIYPLFVVAGENVREEIPSMPDCYHLSVDNAVQLAKKISALGIPAVEIFGLPEYKDEIGSSAWDMKSPVQRAISAIKKNLLSSAMFAFANTQATGIVANFAGIMLTTTRRLNFCRKSQSVKRRRAQILLLRRI